MIAAPSLIKRNRRGEVIRIEALVPVPVAGLAQWNARVREAQRD